MNTAQALERMCQVIRRQHKALATEDCYLFWLRRYMGALHQMPAHLTSEKKLERFLTDLALRCDVAASTQNQALHAILYFYRFVRSFSNSPWQMSTPCERPDPFMSVMPQRLLKPRRSSRPSQIKADTQQISSPAYCMAVAFVSANH
ncbi:MAG TPA: site-specific integrase [Verrucomicrobiae bacterium]|nr:site-specific integrase [Verrucomicrobiae bacterium]